MTYNKFVGLQLLFIDFPICCMMQRDPETDD